jgi:dihydroxyacetone kinase
MSAKHFVDDPTDLVNKSLRSLPRTNPLLSVDVDNKIVFLRSSSKPQVSLVSGGGSGHEPSFGGLVGPGFLTAAVAGTIFASPSASQIRKCLLHRVDSRKGVLVIVMNYTGDGLNFGVAVEKAKATGINIDMLIVGDDVGVGRSRNGRIGRRGIAGTVLVQKVAGAAAASG